MDLDTSTTVLSEPTANSKTNISARKIRLHVATIAGSQFEVEIAEDETVDGLKRDIARKLRVQKERINLLQNQRIISTGSLTENNLYDGCKITLLPNVESGIAPPKNDQNVLNALENLSDSQTKDFLSGRSPLTLMMRMGDHMMFVELQLSTNTPNGRRPSSHKPKPKPTLTQTHHHHHHRSSSQTHHHSTKSSVSSKKTVPFLDGTALAAQASRNISQRLKELSHSELCKKLISNRQTSHSCHPTTAASMAPRPSAPAPGAIIESIYHHGKGVFSGTFSGTLSAAKLQEPVTSGHTRKDVHTIIHILNDLLGATPQHRPGHGSTSSTPTSSPEPSPPPSPTAHQIHELPTPPYIHHDNQATRGKMERLRLMLQERKQKRRVRRQERTEPYPSNCYVHKTSPSSSSPGEIISTESTTSSSSSSTPDFSSHSEPCIA